MKIKSPFLQRFHLNRSHYLLPARSVQVLLEFFQAMDMSDEEAIDDVQFAAFLKVLHFLSLLWVLCLARRPQIVQIRNVMISLTCLMWTRLGKLSSTNFFCYFAC